MFADSTFFNQHLAGSAAETCYVAMNPPVAKPKKVALVACSHKLLRILNAMARTGEPWNEALHVKNT